MLLTLSKYCHLSFRVGFRRFDLRAFLIVNRNEAGVSANLLPKYRVQYKRVSCPKALVDITGCVRTDEDTFQAAAAKAIPANGTKNATSDAIATPGVGSLSTVVVWSMSALFASWVMFI